MIYLKLGGSLITRKDTPEVAQPEVLSRLAREIREALHERPAPPLLVGHGAGSFGHVAAARYGTHLRASTEEDWRGFLAVWQAAQHLHRMVIAAFEAEGLPAMSFSPSASAVADQGRLLELAWEPIARASESGLLPVVHGDVAFDRQRGSTILSTEKVFVYLAQHLPPSRVLLAGLEPGVYADFPARGKLLSVLTSADLGSTSFGSTAGTDVTGGMADKVASALELAGLQTGLEVRILSGAEPGAVRRALLGEPLGTRIEA